MKLSPPPPCTVRTSHDWQSARHLLGSLISHRPGPPLNHPSGPDALSKCSPVTSTSPPGPSLTPHLLTYLPSPSTLLYALSLPPQPAPAPYLTPPTSPWHFSSPLSASSIRGTRLALSFTPISVPPNSSPSPAPYPCPLTSRPTRAPAGKRASSHLAAAEQRGSGP